MSPWLILAIAVGPGLFWLWFFVRRDRLEPEPRALVARLFVLGFFSVIPAALLEVPIPKPLDGILGAPIIEESIKLLVVYLFIYRNLEFDEPMDGITYGVSCALGFATAENIFYVFGAHQQAVGLAVVRALLSVPGHALWAVLWGYGLGRMKFTRGPTLRRGSGPSVAQGFLWGGVALAMLSHAIFNFTCTLANWQSGIALVLPAIAIVGWRVANRRTRDALMRGPLRPGAMPLGAPGRHVPAPPAPQPGPVPPPPHLRPPAPPPPPPPPHELD